MRFSPVVLAVLLLAASLADSESARRPVESRFASSFDAYDCATLNPDANTIDKVTLDFSAYRGKLVILHFWSTGSNNGMLRVGTTVLYPAIDEIRSLRRFSVRHPEIVVLAVHVFTEDPNAVKLVLTALFGEKYPPGFGYVIGDQDTWLLKAAYQNYVYPATFFIGKDGKIAASRDGTLNWDNNPNIEKLVKELSAQ